MPLLPAGALAAPGASGETIHIVQWGETLSLIASRYGVQRPQVCVMCRPDGTMVFTPEYVSPVPKPEAFLEWLKRAKAEATPLDFCAAILSRITGRPVLMEYSREEMFRHFRGRHKQHIKMKIGVRKDGTITAVQEEAVLEGAPRSQDVPLHGPGEHRGLDDRRRREARSVFLD